MYSAPAVCSWQGAELLFEYTVELSICACDVYLCAAASTSDLGNTIISQILLLMNTVRIPLGSPVRKCVVITLPRARLLCFVNSEYFACFSIKFLF